MEKDIAYFMLEGRFKFRLIGIDFTLPRLNSHSPWDKSQVAALRMNFEQTPMVLFGFLYPSASYLEILIFMKN